MSFVSDAHRPNEEPRNNHISRSWVQKTVVRLVQRNVVAQQELVCLHEHCVESPAPVKSAHECHVSVAPSLDVVSEQAVCSREVVQEPALSHDAVSEQLELHATLQMG